MALLSQLQATPWDRAALLGALGDVVGVLDAAGDGASEAAVADDAGVVAAQSEVSGCGELVDCLVEGLGRCSPTSHDAPLVSMMLWVLVRLCRRRLDKSTVHEDNVKRVGQRCIDIVQSPSCRAMASHEVAHPLCYLIMILASDNEENQITLVEQGKAEVLVAQALADFSEHATTLQFALRAVRNLAAHDDNSGPLVQAGVCEALVTVLSRHAQLVADSSSSASSSLTAAGDAACRSAGAKTTVLHVLDCALWATVNLVCDDSSAVIFGAAGGVDALLSALSAALHAKGPVPETSDAADAADADADADKWQAEREGVLRAALQAVRNLTSSTRSLMHYGGALPLTLEVLSRQSQEPFLSFSPRSKVPEAALWCVANFCGDANMGRQLLASGGVGVIANAVVNVHGSDLSAVIGEALAAAALTEGPPPQEGESELLPVPRLTARDVRHSVTGPVAEAALWCLRNLAASGAVFRDALLKGVGEGGGGGSVGAAHLCYELLREYRHREGMAALSCEVLLCLVAGDDEGEGEGGGGEEGAEKKASAPVPPNLAALAQLASIHHAAAARPLWPLPAPEPAASPTTGAVLPLPLLLRDVLAFHQAQVEAMAGEDDELQQPALKLLFALAKFTAPASADASSSGSGSSSDAASIARVCCKAMETHPTDGMVARLGCELLAALRYGVYSHSDQPAEPAPVGVRVRVPVAGGAGADLLASRGLLVSGQVQLGGKTMAEVLHAWAPEDYPPPPPRPDEGEEEEEEK